MGDSERLDIYSFGRQLIETNDLDPAYVLLRQAKMENPNWLLAYWCFYHVGTASWIFDQPDYWQAMYQAAASKNWPRSSERRHFRGDNAIASVAYLKNKGQARLFEPFVNASLTGAAMRYEDVRNVVCSWTGFGPWISFKVADMLERLAICRVDFSRCELFDSPKNAATMLWMQEGRPETDEPGLTMVDWAVRQIVTELDELKAPPRYERKLNVQEAETILCKWKSYCGGHYHVGEDIAACRKGLLRFARTRTAQRLLSAGKEAGLWK